MVAERELWSYRYNSDRNCMEVFQGRTWMGDCPNTMDPGLFMQELRLAAIEKRKGFPDEISRDDYRVVQSENGMFEVIVRDEVIAVHSFKAQAMTQCEAAYNRDTRRLEVTALRDNPPEGYGQW